MTQEMIVPNTGVAKYADEKTFGAVSSLGNFLPRVQLYGSNSEAVKESLIPMAHYGLAQSSKDEIIDLGAECQVVILSWRPLALKINKTENTVVSVFNPKAPDFKKFTELSEIKDSGCMYGPQFLIYVPQEKVFATFFMASKTARRAAGEVKAFMGKAATLKAELIKTPKYTWHGPTAVPCSVAFELPPVEEILEVSAKFNNPPESEEEAAPEDGDRDR
jgi:hypothetical protein